LNCELIQLEGLGKKYQNKWIFKNLDFQFENNRSYAIKGPNGSGKSTLLKILSGFLSPSKGEINFTNQKNKLAKDEIYKTVSFTAPYINLIERLSLEENIRLMLKFRNLKNGLGVKDFIELCQLKKTKQKEIRYFSSGMMQRLKLAITICADTDILLLDEPGTNLDKAGHSWYRSLMDTYKDSRIVIVASNVEADFDFCDSGLSMMDYKKL